RGGLPGGAGGRAGVRGHGGVAQPGRGHRLRHARPESAVRAVSALSFPEHPETFLVPAEHAAPRARRRWYRQPALMTGLVVMGIIVFLALAAPLITSYNPNAQNLTETLQGPSAQHLLGTDQLGRDVWTRLLYGLRLDLSIACLAVLFPFTLGVILGCIAGYFGGWVDNVIMR